MSKLDDLYNGLVNSSGQANKAARSEFKPLILDDEEDIQTQQIDTRIKQQDFVPQYIDTDKPKFVQPEQRSYYVAGNVANNEIHTTAQRPNEIEYEADVVDDEKKKDNYFGLSKIKTNKVDIVKNALKYVASRVNPIKAVADDIGKLTGKSGEDVAMEGVRGFAGSTVDFASSLLRFFGQNYMYFKGMKSELLDNVANLGSKLAGGEDFSDEIQQRYRDFYNRVDEQAKELIDKTERFLQEYGIAKTDKDGFIYDLIGGGASLMYAIGIAAITKSPAAAAEFFGMYQYQSLYEEAIENGFNPIKARTIGVIGGAAEGALEMVGLHMLLETLVARKSFTKLLKAAATEFIQEASQQGAEEILTTATGMREEGLLTILQNVGYAGLIGALIGGGSATVSNVFYKQISDSATRELINKGVNSDYAKQMVNSMLDYSVSPQVLNEMINILKDEQSPVTYKNADPRETYKETGEAIKKALDPAQKRGIELELIQANKKLTQELANVLLNSGKAQNGDDAYRRAEQMTAMYDVLAREAYNQEGIRPEDYYKRFHVNAQSGNIEIDERNVDEDNPFVDVSFDPVDFDPEARAEYEAAMDAEQDYMDQVEKENKTTLKKEARILGDMGIGAIRRPTPDGVGKDRWGEYKDLSPRIKNYFFTDTETAMSWDEAEDLLAKSGNSIKDLFEYLAKVDERAVTLNQPGVFGKVLAKEKEDIKQKAIADGTFLKAPNGKDSNLPEQLWLTVRTKAFKNWFGDWENDPANASKVVDENGEPLVVYHGTANDFRVFDKNKSYQGLFWFSNDYNKVNAGYDGAAGKGVVMPVFLNIKNAADWELYDKYSPEELENMKYDGLLLKDGNETVVAAFDNKQIKSINNRGSFDRRNPDIYYQAAYHGTPHRFDTFSTDKIGTGEGAQAHGWGLYFAKDKGVSENYRKALAINGLKVLSKGKEISEQAKDMLVDVARNSGSIKEDKLKEYFTKAIEQRINIEKDAIKNREKKKKEFENRLELLEKNYNKSIDELKEIFKNDSFMLLTFDDYTIYSKEPLTEDEIKTRTKEELEYRINGIEENLENHTDRLKILQDIDLKSLEIKDTGKGQLFKVDIPENDVLLDEQKVFDEQPKKVQEAILKIGEDLNISDLQFETKNDFLKKVENKFGEKARSIFEKIYDLELERAAKEKRNREVSQELENKIEQAWDEWNNFETENNIDRNEFDPNSIYETINNSNVTGRDIYNRIVSHQAYDAYDNEADKKASLLLNKYGVKGISYNGGIDGRAYVIFDDKAVKVLEKFYQADKNYYERQSRNVELKNKDNREKLLKNGGTEEQADEIENLGALRHKIHSTDVNSLATGDNEDVRKLDDGNINSILEDADLPTLTTSESPLYTTQDTDDIIADYLEKSIDDLTTSDKEQFNSEVVEMWAKWKEKVNNQIEKYLEDIDKKYKTQYKPTGKLRERFQQDDQQEQPRGSITSFDRQYWIDLFSGSDKSTLLHEGSHGWLSEVLYFANGKNPSPKILAIKKQLDNWLGEPEDNGRYSTRQQELFAGASEVYFMEGKAPTPKLKTVFERFKKWLTDIYDAIRNDLPKINDDVRELFDTILSRSYDVPDSNIYAGKEKAIKEVIKNINEGRASEVDGITIDDVYNLLNVAYMRKPSKPSKNLKQLLNDKNIYDFNELNKAGADTVLQILKDGGYVKEDATAEAAVELAKAALDGKPIYRLADQWRVAGDIDFARNLRVLEKVIEFSQIDSVMEKILTLQEEGYRNVEQGDVEQVKDEYKRLMSADVKEAKKIVEDIINRLHKKRFIDRAAQKQMIVDLNFSSTVEEIRESVLNVIEDLQDEIKLVKEQLRNPRKPVVRKDKTIPPAKNATEEEKNTYKKYMRRQINKLLKQALPRKQNQQKFSKFDVETQRFFTDLENYNKMTIEQAQEELYKRATGIIDDEGVGLNNYEKMKNMFLSYKANKINQNTTEFYKQLYDNLMQINVFGRNTKEIEETLKKEQIQKDINSLVVNIEDNKSKNAVSTLVKKAYVLGLGNWWSTINAIAGKKQADKDSLERIEIDIFNKNYETTENLKTKCAAALGLKNATDLDMTVNRYLNEEYTYQEHDARSNTTNAVKLNKMQLICCYIWMKNETLRERIVRAYGNEQIMDMMDKLTIQDKKFGDELQQSVAALYDDVNKVYLKMYGLDMPQAENYFPSSTERIQGNMDLLKDNIGQVSSPGFIKARVQSNLPLMNFGNPVKMALDHISKVNHFIYMQEKLADLNKVYKTTVVKRHITNAYGESIYKYIIQVMENAKFSNIAKTIDLMSNIGDYVTNNYVLSRIAIKPSIMIKQLLSCINYAEDMSATKWFEGFLKGVASPKKTIDFMMKNSKYCQSRFAKGGQSEALLKAMEGSNATFAKIKTFKGALSWMTRVGDIGAIIFGGYPYVMNQMSKGVPLQTAIENFEKSTIRSQQASLPSTLSNWQYRSMNQWFMRAMFAFANTPSQYCRKMGDTMYMYFHGDIDKKQMAKNLMIYGVLNSLLYTSFTSLAILSGLVSGDWDDLKDDIIMSLMQCSNVLAVPLASQGYNYALQKWVFENNSQKKEIPLLHEIYEIIDTSKKEDLEFKDWLTIIDDVASLVTGVPIKTVYNGFVGSTKDLLDGEYGKFAVKLYGATESRANKIFD